MIPAINQPVTEKIKSQASDAAQRRRCLRSANLNRLTVPQTQHLRQSGTRCQMNLEIRTVSILLNGS